jgi:hypothetical protein
MVTSGFSVVLRLIEAGQRLMLFLIRKSKKNGTS